MDSRKKIMFSIFLPFFFGISGAQVFLDVTPSEIIVGCTHLLTINCTFDKRSTTISHVFSILIQYKSLSSNTSYVDVASIVDYNSQVETHSNNENISVSGLIDGQSHIYLSVGWQNPTQHQAGDYECVVNGNDQVGHVMTMSNETRVTFTIQQSSDPNTKIRELEARLDLLDANWNSINIALLTRIGNLEANLKQMESILFVSNTTYRSHQYFLSRYSYRDIDLAMATCHQFGSYLLEIDDQDEYDVIVRFLNNGYTFNGVFVSGSDALEEGFWTFQRTGVKMSFTAWEYPAPTNSEHENCVLLWRSFQWKMLDDPCFDNNNNINVICEKTL